MSLIGILITVLIIASVFVYGFTRPGGLSSLPAELQHLASSISSFDVTKQQGIAGLVLTRDIARGSDMSGIQNALLQYKIEKGIYPQTLEVLIPVYIAVIRNDPLSGKPYQYEVINKGQSYKLCVEFETADKAKNPCVSPDKSNNQKIK